MKLKYFLFNTMAKRTCATVSNDRLSMPVINKFHYKHGLQFVQSLISSIHCLFCVLMYDWFVFQLPFYPISSKDLTFIDLGNDSKVEGLVNFEKLRMIAKEIRHICNMCSPEYVSCDWQGCSENWVFTLECSIYWVYAFLIVFLCVKFILNNTILSLYFLYNISYFNWVSINSCVFVTLQDAHSMFAGTPSEYDNSMFGVATIKRSKNRRTSTVPNAKKMYDEAQMTRRVKSYLSNLPSNRDEDKLAELSNLCEPPG